MYIVSTTARSARYFVDRPSLHGPVTIAATALARMRKILTAYRPGMYFDSAHLRSVLAAPLGGAAEESERLFALGWLSWLSGDLAAAEPLLHEAAGRAEQAKATDLFTIAAYWRARVRVALMGGDAVTEYEGVLRKLSGSPQATAWFVDLLWRAGRVERAEQVWKSVRGNKRVSSCAEGPFLEARVLLRRGEIPPAEKLLNETTPVNAVLYVEKMLLLAWIRATQKQFEAALKLVDEVEKLPYPQAAITAWRGLIVARRDNTAVAATVPVLADLMRGQQARRDGRQEEAITAYRAAATNAAAQPFARYALATLGQDDPATLLASQPGLFVAVRCRALTALQKFQRRESTAAELFDALQQAAHAGYQSAAVEHFRELAQALQNKQPTPNDLQEMVDAHITAQPAIRRNFFLVALEQALRRLPAVDAPGLVRQWSVLAWLPDDQPLRALVARQLVRLLLLARRAGTACPPEILADVQRLSPDEELQRLLRSLLTGEALTGAPSDTVSAAESAPTSGRLWQAACALDHFTRNTATSEALEAWRAQVRTLRSESRLRGLAQALLLQEAAQRGDVPTVGVLLDEVDHWRGFHSGPPRFVLRTLANLVSAQPLQAAWKRSLPRWLQLWEATALGSEGATLAALAGSANADAASAEPPQGVPRVPWLLHQAARALNRDDSEALTYVRRALVEEADFAALPENSVVRAALPELERRAAAHALSKAVLASGATPVAPAVLADIVAHLQALPEAHKIVKALFSGEARLGRKALAALAERADLPPALSHHLAVIEQRAALAWEESDDYEAASTAWLRAWQHWLAYFAATPEAVGTQPLLLDDLLGRHRRRLNDLLARNAMDAARRYWNLIQGMPAVAAKASEPLGRDLAARVERFRDELATDYLLTTREAMRYGAIPQGLHADFEKGLTFLRHLLSLDRDNVRLLTALVEICNEWFLDLYNLGPSSGLGEQVERFTPFALQLARLVDDKPGDLAARAQVADFYKFRGYITRDREQKAALYREALRFNPGNNNVRNLLAELEQPADAPKETE